MDAPVENIMDCIYNMAVRSYNFISFKYLSIVFPRSEAICLCL